MAVPPLPVTCDLDVHLVGPEDVVVAVPVALEYDTTDPYAVAATFHTGHGEGVRWVFARDVLSEGTRRPTGDGDVRVWPGRARGEEIVCIGLRSPDGAALLEAPAAQVRAFVERTYDAVPAGTETDRLDLDATVAALLD